MTPGLLCRAALALCLLLPLPGYAADLVILISIDGFRADYLERGLTPTLARFAENGVRAKAMEPAFPSVTFPNHYSIVTGLVPDHHGIVNNTMRDPAMPGHTFRLNDRAELTNPAWWESGIPIWETLRRQHRKSGAVFWPGTEVAIHDVQPDYWRPYDGKLSVNDRVDAVLKLVSLPPEQRPVFITLYFDAVDHQGHVAGPDSQQVNNALKEVDSGLTRLEQGLRERQLLAHSNLLIVSDHGMAEVSAERIIQFDDFLDPSKYESINNGATAGFYPKPGEDAALNATLLTKEIPHVKCWRRENMPSRFRFGSNPRIPPYYCLAESGWIILTHDARPYDGPGAHGYDPASPAMAALFIGTGPAFRRGASVAILHTVDVYPLLAKLLGVRAETNDGDPDWFQAYLARP